MFGLVWLQRSAALVIFSRSLLKSCGQRCFKVILTPSADNFSLHAVYHPNHFKTRDLVLILLGVDLDIERVGFRGIVLRP